MIFRDPMTQKDPAEPGALPPLARAVMDSLGEGVLVFDVDGRFLYANESARRAIGGRADFGAQSGAALRARLAALGARVLPLRNGGVAVGEVVVLPAADGVTTLAERERQAIVNTLHSANGKLAETARRLGISRTTLWRRLKTYGIARPSPS